MTTCAVIMLIFIHFAISFEPLRPINPLNNSVHLHSCFNMIINKFMMDKKYVVRPLTYYLDGDQMEEDVLLYVLNHIDWPTFIVNRKNSFYKKQQFVEVPTHYVLIANNINKLVNNVNYIKRHASIWENNIRIFVVAVAVEDPQPFIFQANELFKSEDINGVVVTKNLQDNNNFNCYIFQNLNCYVRGCEWNLYSNMNFCQRGILIHNENVTTFGNSNKKLYNVIAINIKPNVINLQNGTLSGPTSLNYGVEHNILNLIAEILNVSFIYYTPYNLRDSGDAYPNRTVVGALNELHKKTADIAIGAYSWTYERSLRFYPVFFHIENKFGWFYPHVLQDSHSIKADPYVIIMILVSFGILVLMQLSFDVLRRRNGHYCYYFMLMYSALINVPTISRSKPIIRRIWFIILFLNLFLTIILYTLLISYLADTTQVEKYGSMKRLFSSNLTIKLDPVEKVLFMDYPFYNRIVDCENDDDMCLKSVAVDKNSAVGTSFLSSDIIINEFSNGNQQTINCIEYPMNYPLVMYMRHGFPYYKNIAYLILHLVEKGFMYKFVQDLKPRVLLSKIHEQNKQKILRFKHLKPVIIWYFIFSSSNVVVCLLEILCYKYNF